MVRHGERWDLYDIHVGELRGNLWTSACALPRESSHRSPVAIP